MFAIEAADEVIVDRSNSFSMDSSFDDHRIDLNISNVASYVEKVRFHIHRQSSSDRSVRGCKGNDDKCSQRTNNMHKKRFEALEV